MGNGALEKVEELKEIVRLRGDCGLLVLLHSDNGLEILSHALDYVDQRGLLAIAVEVLIERQAAINQLMKQKVEQEGMAAVAVMGKKPFGGLN